jgi:hypothetical protein
MGLQKLVCAVEDVDFQVIEGAVVGHDLVEIEEGVVPAPKQQARGLVLAVVGPDGRETRNVRPIVGEDLELDVDDPWPRQALPVEMPALRWIEGRQAIGLISDVLVAGCLEVHPVGQLGPVRLGGIGPRGCVPGPGAAGFSWIRRAAGSGAGAACGSAETARRSHATGSAPSRRHHRTQR